MPVDLAPVTSSDAASSGGANRVVPPPAAPRSRRARALAAAGLVLALAGVVGVAAWMTGPPPRPADAGVAKQPPPLPLLPGVTPEEEAAIAALRGDRLAEARRSFTSLVARDPDSLVGQVGLVLTGWRGVGPRAVERDLAQLVREYPDEPLPLLELGLVQGIRGDVAGGRRTLARAVTVGRATATPAGWAVARLADDVLHPELPRGYPLLLIGPDDVPAADRAALEAVRAAVARDDRAAAASAAGHLARSSSAVSRVAGLVARFDKVDPGATTAAATRIVARLGAARDARDRERDAVLLHAALLAAWAGDRDVACARLAEVADGVGVTQWRRLAAPTRRGLCSSDAPRADAGAEDPPAEA